MILPKGQMLDRWRDDLLEIAADRLVDSLSVSIFAAQMGELLIAGIIECRRHIMIGS